MPRVASGYKELPLAFVQESLALATSGFGLVVALAWNEFVKDLIAKYIQPMLGNSSGTISKFIYALAVTFLAVLVTMQLVRVEHSLKNLIERRQAAKRAAAAKITKEKTKRAESRRSSRKY